MFWLLFILLLTISFWLLSLLLVFSLLFCLLSLSILLSFTSSCTFLSSIIFTSLEVYKYSSSFSLLIISISYFNISPTLISDGKLYLNTKEDKVLFSLSYSNDKESFNISTFIFSSVNTTLFILLLDFNLNINLLYSILFKSIVISILLPITISSLIIIKSLLFVSAFT